MRFAGKEIVIGCVVSLKMDKEQSGKVLRIYPFRDKPFIMVKFFDGRIKSYFASQLC